MCYLVCTKSKYVINNYIQPFFQNLITILAGYIWSNIQLSIMCHSNSVPSSQTVWIKLISIYILEAQNFANSLLLSIYHHMCLDLQKDLIHAADFATLMRYNFICEHAITMKFSVIIEQWQESIVTNFKVVNPVQAEIPLYLKNWMSVQDPFSQIRSHIYNKLDTCGNTTRF